MNIKSVKVESYSRGIPLKGWTSVVAALIAYSQGLPRGSRATQNDLTRSIASTGGGFGLGLYLLNSVNHDPGRFLTEMLNQAKSGIERNNHWSKSYDYDGEGVFHKTSVEITLLNQKDDLYMLEIWAAYVGDEPEIGLAEHLSIPRALRRSSVILEVEPVDEKYFAFNFDKLVEVFKTVLTPTRVITGDRLVSYFMTGGVHDSTKPVALYFDKFFEVNVCPGRVESRYSWKSGVSTDTWTVEGPVLKGNLCESYRVKGTYDKPTIVLTVQNSSQDTRDYPLPVYVEEQKKCILEIGEALKKAFEANLN